MKERLESRLTLEGTMKNITAEIFFFQIQTGNDEYMTVVALE